MHENWWIAVSQLKESEMSASEEDHFAMEVIFCFIMSDVVYLPFKNSTSENKILDLKWAIANERPRIKKMKIMHTENALTFYRATALNEPQSWN